MKKLNTKALKNIAVASLVLLCAVVFVIDRYSRSLGDIEIVSSKPNENIIVNDTDGNTVSSDNTAAEKEQSSQTNENDSSPLYKNDKLNINRASSDDFESLPGIGPTKAKAIIDYRNSYGGFVNIEELKAVSGIGDSTFNKIKDYIYVP